MLLSEMQAIERREQKLNPLNDRRLLPVDSCSQLGTDYTGRSDTDVWEEKYRNRRLLGQFWEPY
jgi:hypothetical protein